jgi:hypothetical protein
MAFALAAAFTRPSPASAHWIWCDSVDESTPSGEIRWTSATTYTTIRDYAIAQWNAVGYVNIAPDNASTTVDLRFYDVNRSDVSWAGEYDCLAIPDKIKLNRWYADGYSDARQKNLVLHELGHALRLGHSFPGQVMNASNSTVDTPQAHDIQDYCRRWRCVLNFDPDGGGGIGGSDRRPTRMN